MNLQWDTANVYSNGVSEEIIAKAIREYQIPRKKLVIMTKCWGVVSEHDNVNTFSFAKAFEQSKDYVNQFGLLFPEIALGYLKTENARRTISNSNFLGGRRFAEAAGDGLCRPAPNSSIR